MSGIIKPVANETSCNTTANTFGNHRLIRLLNSDTILHLVTVANNGVNVATISIASSSELLIEKWPADTLQSNAATAVVLAVPVAYKEW